MLSVVFTVQCDALCQSRELVFILLEETGDIHWLSRLRNLTARQESVEQRERDSR